uniref:Uncharacterized protein n=1 Tax=Cacopsylla melanoneura TaxID=428564 RepID=A0A8D8XB65_9HEMI
MDNHIILGSKAGPNPQHTSSCTRPVYTRKVYNYISTVWRPPSVLLLIIANESNFRLKGEVSKKSFYELVTSQAGEVSSNCSEESSSGSTIFMMTRKTLKFNSINLKSIIIIRTIKNY